MKLNPIVPNLKGIIEVLNTPFTDQDKIDVKSLKRYVNYCIEAGVVGFLVPAMAAEVQKLSFAEKKLIVATVLEEVDGRVPVIGGASAEGQEARVKIAKSLIRLGCEGVLVSIPFTNEPAFVKDVYEIASLKPDFLMIQDWDFTGYGIPVPTIVRLFNELEVFQCLKVEVVPAGVKYSEVLRATQGRLHVSGGWAGTQMIEALDRGVNAFMPTVLPEVYTKIYRLHRSGNREAAKNLFYELVSILAFSHQHLDISIHFSKRLVHRLGIYDTSRVRQPILPFDEYHKRVSGELIEKAIELIRKVETV